MKTKRKLFIFPKCLLSSVLWVVAVTLLLGVIPGSAQTDYLYSGFKQSITLNPGIYYITAYGAQGGTGYAGPGSFGAEMEGEFDFTTATTLTVLVGGVGGSVNNGEFGAGGGGGGGSFVANGSTPLVVAGGGGGVGTPGFTGTSGGSGGPLGGAGGTAGGGGGSGGYGSGGGGGFSGNGSGPGGTSFLNGGEGGGNGGFGGGGGGQVDGEGGGGGGYSGGGGGGYAISNPDFGFGGGGGGSYIDSSAIAIIAEVSNVASPNDSLGNGEIIITAVPEPCTLALVSLSGFSLLLFRRKRK